MPPDGHKVRQFGANIQIGMLPEERQSFKTSSLEGELFHLPEFDDVLESGMVQREADRRILKAASGVLWHYDGAYPVTQLQERLEQNMVLVIVRDDDEINMIGQILVGI